MLAGGVIVPAVGSRDGAAQSAPPCRYNGLPAACTIGTRVDPQASAANASSNPVATIHPIHLVELRSRERAEVLESPLRRTAPPPHMVRSRGPSSHLRSRCSRRKRLTGSVMFPVFGVRNHGPSSFCRRPFSPPHPWTHPTPTQTTTPPTTP